MTARKPMQGPLMWAVFALTLIAIILLFVWDLASEQAEQRVRSEQSAKNHIEYAEDRIDQKCLGLEPMPMRNCIHQEIESSHDHYRSNQDLTAQQQMAFFTKVMAWTAVGGLALGAVSIVVIYATLNEMGRTNHIMREESRPWIKFEFTASLYESDESKIQIGYQPKNIGARPAFDVSIAERIINSREFMQKSQSERAEIIAEVKRNASNWASLSPVIFPQDYGYGFEPVEDIDLTQEISAFLLICVARYRDRHGGRDRFTIQSAQVRINRDKQRPKVIVHPWQISGAS